jgi:PPOX class probable F420-dependent enzyme
MEHKAREFLERTHSAAMITLRPDGTPHAVRVGVALVDGRLWSSGTQARVRTMHLRRDPRSTLFVFDAKGPETAWRWLTLEATVTILEGPDAPEQNLRLFRVMQRQPEPRNVSWAGVERTPDEFLRIMAEERRLIYEFEPIRTYGLY